jgi:seryl-tRNA synthetase
MLDINLLRERGEWAKAQIEKRGVKIDFAPLLKADDARKKILFKLEEMRAGRNRESAEIAKVRDKAERDTKIAQMKKLGDEITEFEKKVAAADKAVFELAAVIPNIPLDEVQVGGKEANRVERTFGKKPDFSGFKPRDHVDLCTALGIIDYERAGKMSGAGTWAYVGMGARLEMALWNYMMDFHVANGYTPVLPPYLLNYESGYSAGQFPKFRDEVFCTTIGDDKEMGVDSPKFRFLLPTSETALINMHRGEILAADRLPMRYAGFSQCFRKECAGYGTKERGIIRGYQFNKIEMFAYCLPEDSPKMFAEFVGNAEKLVDGLGLHFQTMALASGDLGPVMAKTYDIEVYIPSMGGYKEVSSCSTAGDYQARRSGIRTKTTGADGKTETRFVHTLNGSGLATSRLFPAIIEQFQTADGHVRVPKALQRYMGGVEVI